MKRWLTAVVILAMIVTVAYAAPTVTAGNGIFRVQNAAPMHKGAFGFNLHWAGSPVGAYHMNDGVGTTWDAVLRLGASWTPLEFLEVGLVPALGYYKPDRETETQIGIWDLEINAKASYISLSVLKLGIQARTLLPLASEPFFPADYSNGLDFGTKALITADLGDVLTFPIRFHLNAGYTMTGDDMAGTAVTDYIPIAAGVEFDASYVTVFAELYSDYPLDNDVNADMWATPGIRFAIPQIGLNVDFGMDFLLFKAEDDLREDFYRHITAGVSWTSPEKVHIPMGDVAGTVKDAETDQGIVADVSYTGPEMGVLTTGTLGFAIDSLDPGVYTFEVTADGYETVKRTVTVSDGVTTQIDFELESSKVMLSGAVHDRETDAGLPGILTFLDADIPDVRTDGSTGLYEVELKPGTYRVEVSSEGYLPQTASIIVGRDGAVKDFDLIKEGMKIAFRGINFETAKAVILPESYPVLDEAAQILKDNPDIRVEIGGHTDSRGSASYNLQLSQDRAAAVRLYLIENHGIESNRMIAKGYGETQPVALDDTEENMFLNRRVEFTILNK